MLLANAKREILLCAPFMKFHTVRRLLETVEVSVHVKMITRWHADEVRLGVTDLAVFDIAQERPDTELLLLDNLHAKLYLADDVGLVGSSNLTAKALGWTHPSNLEILLRVGKDTEQITRCLSDLESARLATAEERTRVEAEAAAIKDIPIGMAEDLEDGAKPGLWLPVMAAPKKLYDAYSPELQSRLPSALIAAAEQDLTALAVPSGLSREDFEQQVALRFAEAPAIKSLLNEIEGDELDDNAAMDRIASMPTDEILPLHRQWEVVREWLNTFHGDRIESVPAIYTTRRRPGKKLR
ncbi:hypothetical protein E3U23_07455 [Erythrobacter litoralis]|uniref:phospholipase D family protein n=1 Tax=Erythrobacter litoralis TaxID=39960 RepID=UPI002434B87D|nr:phospholipase D family protein [Erythrobacter litoralis]MDG6079026.1 hypothetical protein [Erythrobacter litoralis]